MPFLNKFVTLKELTIEGLTDSFLEHVRKHYETPRAWLSLFEAFLNIIRIFGSIQPQSESTSPFLNITIFQKMATFGTPSLHSGERWTYASTDFFVQNFKSRSIMFIINRKIMYNNINSVLYVHTTTLELANHIFFWRQFYLRLPHSRRVFTLIRHTLVV